MTDAIIEKNARIVSFYTRCDIYHIVLLIADQLKRRSSATIVFGGPQADIVAKETLTAFPCVDYICQGEGETTILPFFSSLLRDSADHSVDGLVYRKGNEIVQNPRPALLHDLDLLPEIDFSLIGMTGDCSYIDRFPVDVGRGCPFGCSYCSTNTFWGRKYRIKTPERIFREVQSLHEKYGITSFSFSHDMFTLDRKQVIKLCHMMKDLDFPIKWSCSARVDCIDDELIDIMFNAGMRWIYLGIETGSERMQKLIHKNLKLHAVMDRLQYIHAKGIHIVTSFIHGFPDETPEDLSETLSLIAELTKFDNIAIQNHLCAFLPGTELSTRYAKELVAATFFSDQTGSVGAEECAALFRAHPDVFPQFMEYRTDLRDQLEHFPLFVRFWSNTVIQPVYQYCAGLYEKDRLIDMYFDFVEVNRSILEKAVHLPYAEKLALLLEHDALPQRLVPEDLREVVRDCYRMAVIQSSPQFTANGQLTELFCFSPKELKRNSDISKYVKKPTVVHYKKTPDNRVEMTIKSAF